MRAGKENGLYFPNTVGSTGQTLISNGSGGFTWATPPTVGGTNGQVQFNNSGTLSGETGLTWDPATSTLGLTDVDTGIMFSGVTNEPTAPASGMRLYAKSIANKMFPKFIGPSGLDIPVASAPWANGFSLISAGASTTINVIGCTVTAVGTVSTPTIASTSMRNQTRRFQITSSTTAGTLGSLRVNATECWRGNSSGMGGFFVVCRFSLVTLQSGMRAFVGLTDAPTTAATNIDPTTSTTPGKLGMAINSNSGTWSIVSNVSGTTPTVITLNSTTFAINTTDMYELIMFTPPFGSTITYRVSNLTTGTAPTTGTFGSNVPGTTTFLGRVLWTSNNATAASTAMDCSRFYLETDY